MYNLVLNTNFYRSLIVDIAWIKTRIAKTKAQIEEAEDAQSALISGGIQSYTLNTGQTVQTVTRANMNDLKTGIDALYNRLVMLESRLTGSNVTRGVPSW